MHKVNDKVIHRIARGVIKSIDTSAYSIPMFTVELTAGKYSGTLIIGCCNDFQPDTTKGFMPEKESEKLRK